MVSIAVFHARVRGSLPGSLRFEINKNVSSPSTCKTRIVGSFRDREIACSGPEFRILCLEDSVISFISSSSGCSPGPVQPICAQVGLKPDSFHFFTQ